MANNRFRNFMTGKQALLLSDADYKLVVLRGNLTIVGMVVGFSYIFIDRFSGISGNDPVYISTMLLSAVAFFLNRAGRHRLASILFVSSMNLIIYIFSATETYRSGVYIYFIVVSLTSFALFGYRDRKLALFFPLFSLILFFYSYWGNPGFLPQKVFTEEYLKISFTANFIVALVTSIAIVYFLIDVNFHSEKQILTKNEQLAKANTELDRFVYSASHDLRAPLSSMLGLVQLYRLSNDENEKKQVVALIQERVNKLDSFIREILDYSRNSRLQVKNEKINGQEIVHEVIEGLRYSKGFEKIKFDLEETDCELVTDVERFKVVLNNLLANSLKYHDDGKAQPLIKISFLVDTNHWRASVEDNGIGIHPEHHDKIFDMFYRAHENSEGSGLGLYIVKEVVDRMGGTVSFESTQGKGSHFVVSFPLTN